LFEKWTTEGTDILTYRKDHYDRWPDSEFSKIEVTINGNTVSYELSERTVAVKGGFSMREVRRLCDSGHQTAVVATVQQLPTLEVAGRMFSRWRQENYFQYRRQAYSPDHLYAYDLEPADPDRMVPNPVKREKKDLLKHQQNELKDLKRVYADAALQNSESQRRTMRGFKIVNAEPGKTIRELEEQCERTRAEPKGLPSKVLIKTLRPESDICVSRANGRSLRTPSRLWPTKLRVRYSVYCSRYSIGRKAKVTPSSSRPSEQRQI
jgi:hypothetical protein